MFHARYLMARLYHFFAIDGCGIGAWLGRYPECLVTHNNGLR